MQSGNSPFLVNIVPLQNVITNASGIDQTQELTNTVAGLTQMVNFEQKRVYTDFLSAYTPGNAIQVLSPMNMSDVPFTTSGSIVSGGGGSSLSNGTTNIQLLTGGTTAITMTTAGTPALSMSNDGSAVFTGNVYAQSFITLSDSRSKVNTHEYCERMDELFEKMDRVITYSYSYVGEKKPTLGFVAQEVEQQFPECVVQGENGVKYVNYQAMTALLWKIVQDLVYKVENGR